MSKDMSMFKKMKERITDEVNSATNKLQNMQIIDQFASSISQQLKNTDFPPPNQLLPEPQDPTNFLPTKQQSFKSNNNKFSLMDDGPPVGGFNEEEELNSEISPQHQLFDEHSIPRLNHHLLATNDNGNLLNNNNNNTRKQEANHRFVDEIDDDFESVINHVNALNSDIEDGYDHQEEDENERSSPTQSKEDELDVEIDLLSEHPVPLDHRHNEINDKPNNNTRQYSSKLIKHFKNKYKTVVHEVRVLNREYSGRKRDFEIQKSELNNQISALKMELDLFKQQQISNSNQQHDSLISISTTASENGRGSSVGSPQTSTKAQSKLKDLERLLAKCKESLKLKNSQIQNLKDSLSEVEKFRELNQQLRNELAELRQDHETWTVSIAENKRTMHQEIENKNAEMEKSKSEINELQLRLVDSNGKIRQLKSAIQDLESRLVSTSAAHQKERESLTKELTISKNTALRHLQLEHEHNIEKVKLELERSIEALKLENLQKDEQIIRSATQQQQLIEKNNTNQKELDECKQQLQNQVISIEELQKTRDQFAEKCSALEKEINGLASCKNCYDLEARNKEQLEQIETLQEQVKSVGESKLIVDEELKELASKSKVCDKCQEYQDQLSLNAEKFQQELHDLHNQLKLMTNANDDQEKEISLLKAERDKLSENFRISRLEFEELHKKNESLTRLLEDNENDLQSHQEQLNHWKAVESELDFLKKENAKLSESMNQLKLELEDKSTDLNELREKSREFSNNMTNLENQLETANKISEDLRKEKDSLSAANENFHKQNKNFTEQLVLQILSALKNLETPNTSPGSEKSYESIHKEVEASESSGKPEKSLPDPLVLMEELSSMAFDRSNAYMTTTQRLQAVLLDNSRMSEEIKRLRVELNEFIEEKTRENQCSIEEVEKLQTENQALIHDQESYERQIQIYVEEIADLERKIDVLAEKRSEKEVDIQNLTNDCSLKEHEIGALKSLIADKEKSEKEKELLLQDYKSKVEELDKRIHQLETDCIGKDEHISEISQEIERLKEVDSSKLQDEVTNVSVDQGEKDSNEITSSRSLIDSLEVEKASLLERVTKLEKELEQFPSDGADHTYQIKALKRLLEQYQDENQRLKANQKNLNDQMNKSRDVIVPDSTQFEYLKNIVYQFMLGREPLVLARVISAVFKFDKNQIDQICKVQETVQTALKQGV